MKISIIILSLLCFCFSGHAAQKNPFIPKKAVAAPVKKQKVYRKKALKYVAPPQDELKSGSIPIKLPVPEEIVNLLAGNKLEDAVRLLRIEPPSSKTLRILREVQQIVRYKKGEKPSSINKQNFYQNLGIAYHNLFLFLKRNGITNQKFYKGGMSLYKKACSTGSLSEKYEVQVLMAAFTASNEDIEAAAKRFRKVEALITKDSYTNLEYIAAYYASIRDLPNTIETLKQAYNLNPGQISFWVAISDDFYQIEGLPEFKALFK